MSSELRLAEFVAVTLLVVCVLSGRCVSELRCHSHFLDIIFITRLSHLCLSFSFQNIILQNEKPYTRFGVNALVLFTQAIGDIEPVSLSLAATVQTLNFINVGVGYSFGRDKVFILTGVSFSFN